MTGAGCSAIRADFAAAMTYIRTPRLQLEAIDVRRPNASSLGVRDQPIVGRRFPLRGRLGAVGGFLRGTAAHGEQRPFGYYRITRLADERAIGGIGFKVSQIVAASRSATASLPRPAAMAMPPRLSSPC